MLYSSVFMLFLVLDNQTFTITPMFLTTREHVEFNELYENVKNARVNVVLIKYG